MSEVNNGISADAQKRLIAALNSTVADEHVLYIKLRNYHWNVTGARFQPLHAIFEGHYTSIAELIDEAAELVVQLGGTALGTMDDFVESSVLKEAHGTTPEADDMLADLVLDHETLIRAFRKRAETADGAGAIEIVDFFTRLIQKHSKMCWFMRSLISED